MIWVRLILLSGILLSTTCNPISSRATNRLEEIRAKATAHREKIKASNAKILNRIRSSASHSKKSKRQLIDDFGEDVLPEMVPAQEATQKFYIIGQQPMFEKSTGDESEWVGSPGAIADPLHHKIHHPQHGKIHKMPVYKPHHMTHHPMRPPMQHGHIKHQRFRSHGVPSLIVGCAQEPIPEQVRLQAVQASPLVGQESISGENSAEEFVLENARDALADPTFHHHIFHGHHHHGFHHIPPAVPFVTPVTSGINLNIHQNQGFSTSLQGGSIFPQGRILPSIQGSIINQQQQVGPSFQSQISQSQVVGDAQESIFQQDSSPESDFVDHESMNAGMSPNEPSLESGRNADPDPGFFSDFNHQAEVHVASGIASGIKSGIKSGIDAIATKVKGVATELSSGITQDFSAGITSGVSSGVTPGQTTSDIVPGITSGIPSVTSEVTKVPSSIEQEVTSGKVPGIASGATSAISSVASKVNEVSSGVTSSLTPTMTPAVSSGTSASITPEILPGFSAGIKPGIIPEVHLNINTNHGSLPVSHGSVFPQQGFLPRSSSLEPSDHPKDESDLKETRNADADPSFFLNSNHQNNPQDTLIPDAHTVVQGIASGSASGVPSITSKVTGVASGNTPEMASGITTGIAPGVTPGITSHSTGEVTSVTPKINGVTSGVVSGLPSGVAAGTTSGITPGIPSKISVVTSKGTEVTSGLTSSITPGISQGSGSTFPGSVLPQHGSLFRSSPIERSSSDHLPNKSDAEDTLGADSTLHSHVHEQGNLHGSVITTAHAVIPEIATVPSGISSDTPKVTTGIISGLTSEITPSVTLGIVPDITGRIASETTSGMTSGKSAVMSEVSEVTSGIKSGTAPGINESSEIVLQESGLPQQFRSTLNEQSDSNNSKNASNPENSRNAEADPTVHPHFQHQIKLHDSILPTVQTVLPGITSGVSSKVSSVTGVTSGITSGFTPGVTSGIVPGSIGGITSGVPSGISTGITSKLTEVTSGIGTGIVPQISAGITSGITPGVNQGFGTVLHGSNLHHGGNLHGSIIPTVQTVLPGITSGITSGVSSVTSKVTGITSHATPGIMSGIRPDITSGIISGTTSGNIPGLTSGISSGIRPVTTSGINLNINQGSILPQGFLIDQQQKFTQTKTFGSSQIMKNAEESMHEGGYVESQKEGPRFALPHVWAHSVKEPNVRITLFHSSSDEDLSPDDFGMSVSPQCCSARDTTQKYDLGNSRHTEPLQNSNFDNIRGFKLPPGIVTPEVAAALETISKIKSEVEFRKLPGATARVTSGITPDGHLVRDAGTLISESDSVNNSGLGQEEEPILQGNNSNNSGSSRSSNADPASVRETVENPRQDVIPGIQAPNRAQPSGTQIMEGAQENPERQSQLNHEQYFDEVAHESHNLDVVRASEEPNMHVHFFRTAEDDPNLVGAPYIFNVPRRRDETDSDWNKYKRSTKIDSNQAKSDSAPGRKLEMEGQSRKIVKRSASLIRLLNDPNAKLDLPKTLENFGSVTRRALEDRRAPIYHLNHLLGSSKNAVMSALKVPPHNLIIPSDYDIVRVSDKLGAQPLQEESSDEDRDFTDTFVKLGHMVRDSFKSGKDTASHIGDVASDARNILNTARFSGPRLLAPYAHIPALQNPLLRSPKKPLLLTPEERLASRQSNLNTVRLGHIMDAVGLSKPGSPKLALDKLGVPPKLRYLRPRLNDRLVKIYNRVNNNIDDNIDTVGEAVNVLEDARLSTGAKSLRDFLVKMKNEISSIIKNKPSNDYYHHAPTERRSKTNKKKKEQDKEVGKFIENLFDQNDGKKTDYPIVVGDIQNAPPRNMASRMHISRDGEEDRKHKTYTLTMDDQVLGDMFKYFQAQNRARVAQENNNLGSASDLGYVLGAINPLMFERMYNETLDFKRASVSSPQELFQRPRSSSERESAADDRVPQKSALEEGAQTAAINGTTLAEHNEETVGTGMKLTEPMLKPFMGQIQPEAISKFMDSYNNPEENSVEMD